jgi:hypothetical protein
MKNCEQPTSAAEVARSGSVIGPTQSGSATKTVKSDSDSEAKESNPFRDGAQSDTAEDVAQSDSAADNAKSDFHDDSEATWSVGSGPPRSREARGFQDAGTRQSPGRNMWVLVGS